MDEALKDPKIPDSEKAKIRLAQQAKQFAESDLGLTPSKNYTDYVPLNRPYVVYAVNAAEKWNLKSYLWSFPFVGEVPYKGYFDQGNANAEATDMEFKGYDTYVRGVSAYSTLGYFRDALLSSMTRYEDHDLVDTIIHESTHATLYIKSSADFNERLAVFVGHLGTERFYLNREGPDSKTLKLIRNENTDEILFSEFIKHEIEDLQAWYQDPQNSHSDASRTERLKLIQENFLIQLKPKLKTEMYSWFDKAKLNNARLMLFKTYLADLHDFENLFVLCEKDLSRFLKTCKGLEKSSRPEVELKQLKTCL